MESVFITAEGKWKLAGKGYSHQMLEGQQYVKDGLWYDCLHCAPQWVRSELFTKLDDIFSVGVLIVDFMLALKKDGRSKTLSTDSKQAY